MRSYTKEISVFLLGVGVVLIGYTLLSGSGFNTTTSNTSKNETAAPAEVSDKGTQQGQGLTIYPIAHASGALIFENTHVVMDPVGEPAPYLEDGTPDIVLVTDTHGDHLDITTLEAIVGDETALIVPQAVYDELSESLKAKAKILANGESTRVGNISVTAVPMYNLPETADSRHVKGRGNGYLVDGESVRIYIAGDTSNTPEMRALTGVDVAFVPMNLPYTMGVEEAAEAVLAFKPAEVYPYHYRTPDGFSDVAEFVRLVNEGDPEINVVQLNWYRDASGGEAES